MSEAKHTPGPWAQQLQSNGVTVRHVQIVSDAGDVATAICQGSEQKTNANARLIAAAPELLETLQRIIAAANASTNDTATLDWIADTASSAIAKATNQ